MIAEQTGTSIAMIQGRHGKYFRDDGNALFRAYVEQPKLNAIEQKTETFSSRSGKQATLMVVPTGLEPVFPT